jgi:hypothetical protein
VGALLLEACTDRAGDMAMLRAIPDDKRLGVGLVNQKLDAIEPFEAVLPRARRAVDLFGADRLILHPDCGFATFADNPIASARVAAGKLAVLAQVAAAPEAAREAAEPRVAPVVGRRWLVWALWERGSFCQRAVTAWAEHPRPVLCACPHRCSWMLLTALVRAPARAPARSR